MKKNYLLQKNITNLELFSRLQNYAADIDKN